MTHLTARLAPPNGLLLVLDPSSGQLPETMGGQSIAATPSSLAIGTLAEFDGETEVHLSTADEFAAGPPDLTLRWNGTLTTTGRLGIVTTYNDVVLDLEAGYSTTVEVWANDPSEPDVIWVVMKP